MTILRTFGVLLGLSVCLLLSGCVAVEDDPNVLISPVNTAPFAAKEEQSAVQRSQMFTPDQRIRAIAPTAQMQAP